MIQKILCPSDRVQAGCFGAALMADPNRVSECFQAMLNAAGTNGPKITAKIRLGIDDQTHENTLPEFIDMLNSSNIKHVIIELYLDVVNLFLHLLSLLSDN